MPNVSAMPTAFNIKFMTGENATTLKNSIKIYKTIFNI